MSFIAEISKALKQAEGDKLGSSLAVVKSATDKKVKVEIDGAEIEAFYNCPGKPANGAKCVVSFPEGSPDRATASGFDKFESFETTLSNVKLTINSDGIIIELESSQKVEIKGDIELDGKLKVTGEISSDEDVKAGTISLKTHTHNVVSIGNPTGVSQ